MDNYFPNTYEESRTLFQGSLERIRACWPKAVLDTHALSIREDLTIDWIRAEAPRNKNLVIISTGEHGIEGYVGAAMLRLFIEDFAPRLDPQDTSLLLVHAINPHGMKHHRKVNENNVDLNRNFVFDGNFNPNINLDYKDLDYLLAPSRPPGSLLRENFLFLNRVLEALLTKGMARTSRAALLGQYHTPKGFFFGGEEHEESTTVMMSLYREAFEGYQAVTHIDMHTGYGPRDQMSILLTSLEPMRSGQAVKKFNYPLVLETNQDEFYEMNGDMIDYIYRLREKHFPERDLLSCSFEFGTFGSSLPARIRSLKAMVMENQLYWNGSASQATVDKIRREFDELYYPAEGKWREKALQDARQALEGILKARDLL
ncbi:MAG: DUF2817 domain-containing protein [Anaerolineales bacterium]|nr:DUF2817 domain-containing protein [Anaerolineales bacterium]